MSQTNPVEMNYCRRCGSPLTNQGPAHVFGCDQGHIIFANASPAVGVLLYTSKNEVLILERGIDPGLGYMDIPGGFCDGAESLEDAMRREIQEEVGINPSQYGPLEYVMSAIDPYLYKGEVLPVESVIFRAQLKGPVTPIADDDAASATFIALDEIPLDKVYFASIRRALELAQQQ